jgi:RNA polymerase sigma factor (sigma-70 family)
MRIDNYTDAQLIDFMRNGHPDGLTYAYKYHREYCMNFMKSKYYDHEEIQDIFQDAVIVLYEKVQHSDFELTCSIQTYLNSICRNQIFIRLKKAGKFVQGDEETDDSSNGFLDWFEESDGVNHDRVKIIQRVLLEWKSQSSKCYEILVRFFYRKQSMSQIAYDLGYTNADNSKNQKARCQQKLKVEVFKRLRRE